MRHTDPGDAQGDCPAIPADATPPELELARFCEILMTSYRLVQLSLGGLTREDRELLAAGERHCRRVRESVAFVL